MGRFGNDFNPFGRDRDRFESQVDFIQRVKADYHREEIRADEIAERNAEAAEMRREAEEEACD